MSTSPSSLSEVKFNPVVPKHSKAFLLLSSEMAKLTRSPHTTMNWAELDRLCQRVFLQQGYDLTTGAWFCLIQLRLAGWSGAAKSLELFASALSFGERHGQDVGDIELPRSMLTWFIANALTPMYTQSQSTEDGQSMSRAESALDIISRKAKKLNVRDADTLSNLCYFLQVRARTSHNIVLNVDHEQQMQLVCKASPAIDSASTPPQEETAPAPILVKDEKIWRWLAIGAFAATVVLSFAASIVWLYARLNEEPAAISALNALHKAETNFERAMLQTEKLTEHQIAEIDIQLQALMDQPVSQLLLKVIKLAAHIETTHPNNLATANWRSGLLKNQVISNHAGGWLEIQQRLSTLEQRLLESEKKQRNHITISELKTEVYEMKQAMQKMETPVSVLLWMRKKKSEKGESVKALDVLIEQKINNLAKEFTQTAS
ncbi:VasL domain-containing protein [Pantoea sp. SS70]|uniref:VasL domain-containing protein n=1 Tax=Pantoea sp. SS70 TaxID=3024247 RepID=UPI002453201E|nr:VasL domain-containing protein [Pantoea sp. SS70]WGK60105.1 VasL domain-containing protein [Pantoea sp. SS70]